VVHAVLCSFPVSILTWSVADWGCHHDYNLQHGLNVRSNIAQMNIIYIYD
jgi:hypothetical protein